MASEANLDATNLCPALMRAAGQAWAKQAAPKTFYHGSPNAELTELRPGSYVTPERAIAELMGRFHLDSGKTWADDDLAVPHKFGQEPKWRPGREPKGRPVVYAVAADDSALDLLGNPYEHRTKVKLPLQKQSESILAAPETEPAETLLSSERRLFKEADLLPGIQLQEHQQRISDRVSGDNPRMLVYHGLGSGKSLSALAAAEAAKTQHGDDYGIVVPASLKGNFQKEVKKFTNSSPEIMSYTGLGMGKQFKDQPETLIMDEAARLRNPDAASTRAAFQAAQKAKNLLLLTGTPITNEPKDLASLVSMLTKQQISPAEFNEKFVGEQKVWPGLWGWLNGAKYGIKPIIKNGPKLRSLLEGKVDYQPSKTPDGVNVDEQVIRVPLSPEQQKIQKALRTKVPPGFLWKLDSEFPLSRDELAKLNSFMTGFRQVGLSTQPFRADKDPLKAFQQSAKLQAAFKNLKQTLDSDERKKAIIYSNFVDAGLGPYAAGLTQAGIPNAMFHGGVSPKVRQAAIDAYNAGKIRALLLGPAGAEGISTRGTSLIQLMDPHWNEARSQQAEGRGLRFDSHLGLPEELKNVAVQRYISGSEEPSPIGKLMGYKRERTGDEVLEHLTSEKEKFNEEFRNLLKELGTKKTAAVTTQPTAKKKPASSFRLPGVLGGLGALGLGATYGLASDHHANDLRAALARNNAPLGPDETAMTRYVDIMSYGARSKPFGVPVGEILALARHSPQIMNRIAPNYTDKGPGGYHENALHYDLFSRGPIAAYDHMLNEALPDTPLTWQVKLPDGTEAPAGPPARGPDGLPVVPLQPKHYAETFSKPFADAFNKWKREQAKPGGYLAGASGWLRPAGVTTRTVPHDEQMKFLREFEASMPREDREAETLSQGPSLETNKKNYLPVYKNVLNFRDNLKNTSFGLLGGAAGGSIGHYLARKYKEKHPLAYWASVLGGTGLGGAAGYLGSAHGQEVFSKLFGQKPQ